MKRRCLCSWIFLLPFIVSGQQQQQLKTNRETETCTSSSPESCAEIECRLYLAPSALGGFGVFSGISVERFDAIGSPDLILPIVDPYNTESSLLHSIVWNSDIIPTLTLENKYLLDVFVPGLGTLAQCHKIWHNVNYQVGPQDAAGVHRSTHASAGSFSYRSNYTVYASQSIGTGEELFHRCSGKSWSRPRRNHPVASTRPKPKTGGWLREHGICIDVLKPGLSTIPGAGRGAFSAANHVSKGHVVATSPVLPLHRLDMAIYSQTVTPTRFHDEPQHIFNATQTLGYQLLTNYLLGHANASSVALLPTAPLVNFINHSPKPNVKIEWNAKVLEGNGLELSPSDLLRQGQGLLFIDYVALRDIGPGEEVLLDYGADWSQSWEDHREKWQGNNDPLYFSASAYTQWQRGDNDGMIRTAAEQEKDPYPSHLMTACYYKEDPSTAVLDEPVYDGMITWADHHDECLRPCVIMERDDEDYYTAVMHPLEQFYFPDECYLIPEKKHTVTHIPGHRIQIVDKMYSADQHLPHAFRHMIGVPTHLYPKIWLSPPLRKEEVFAKPGLQPNEVSQVKWAATDEPVSKYAFRVGLDPNLSRALLEYCNRTGITDAFQHLLIEGNPLPPGEDMYTLFGDYNWYIQRPESHWKSNMHWISPADEAAHEDYLRVLSAGGFDSVLSSIGTKFGFDGLVAYHVTFIGVSHCSKGFIHHDFKDIGGRAFNVIIPLILANETGPELELRQDGDEADEEKLAIGSYKYEPNVASMVGDMAKHATAACDYRDTHEMRMAATVYIADVRPEDVATLMDDFTQAFPPKDDPSYLMFRAGSHWQPDGSKRLPRPFIASDLRPIGLGEISPMKWEVGSLTKYAHRVGLPPSLRTELYKFADQMGITDFFYEKIVQRSYLRPGRRLPVDFRGDEWVAQRPPSKRLNLHWLSPADDDDDAHNNVLRALSAGGFDAIIHNIGVHFELDSLSVYSVAFMGVSRNVESFMRVLPYSGGKIFKIIVPLDSVENVGPDFEIWSDDKKTMGTYQIEQDVGLIFGDGAFHAIAKCDYREGEDSQFGVQIFLGELSTENVDALTTTLELSHSKKDHADHILRNGDLHWDKFDLSTKLPLPINNGDFKTNQLRPNEISQFQWLGSEEEVAEFGFRVGLHESVSQELLDYCSRMGITSAFQKLVLGGDPLAAGSHRFDNFGGYRWYVQRPDSHWKSNMHWISPADNDAHEDYLRVLSAGGFDQVLNSVGTYFNLDGLSAYHVTFIAVSKCEKGYIHYDFTATGGKAFNIIIPLILANETGPELDIQEDDGGRVGRYKYELNVAAMVGDDALHATSAVDYLSANEMRMAATVYIADINADNIESIMNDFTQAYPPKGDLDFLLNQAGQHWSPIDKSKRLPVPIPQ